MPLDVVASHLCLCWYSRSTLYQKRFASCRLVLGRFGRRDRCCFGPLTPQPLSLSWWPGLSLLQTVLGRSLFASATFHIFPSFWALQRLVCQWSGHQPTLICGFHFLAYNTWPMQYQPLWSHSQRADVASLVSSLIYRPLFSGFSVSLGRYIRVPSGKSNSSPKYSRGDAFEILVWFTYHHFGRFRCCGIVSCSGAVKL